MRNIRKIVSLVAVLAFAASVFGHVSAASINMIYLPIVIRTEPPPPPPPPGTITPKGDGWYLVNSEIAPGFWRSNAGSISCYWERDKDLNRTLDSILGNYFGNSGGLIHILSSDLIVEFNGCGTWTYLPPDYQKILQPNATSLHSDGVYMIGVDIAPGTWRTIGGYSNCYWERDRDALGSLGDIISNYFGLAGGFITIAPTDLQVKIDGCGGTTYIGP